MNRDGKKIIIYLISHSMAILMWPIYSIIWRRNEHRRCIILAYHDVGHHPRDRYAVFMQSFKRQMEYLSRHCSVISLNDWFQSSEKISSLRRNVIITFDDAHEDFIENVYPLLNRYHFSAHLFIPTGLVVPGDAEKVDAGQDAGKIPRSPWRTMNWDQIRSLDPQTVIPGSHTQSHPRMGLISEERIKEELRESSKTLERKLGRKIQYFAYPYSLRGGGLDSRRESFIQARLKEYGYEGACTTDVGFNRRHSNRYHLRRIQIFQEDDLFMFRAKVRGAVNWTGMVQRGLRCIEKWLRRGSWRKS